MSVKSCAVGDLSIAAAACVCECHIECVKASVLDVAHYQALSQIYCIVQDKGKTG